jgi:hypothetical protein
MGARIRCVFLAPTDQVELSLRRFVFPSLGYECDKSGMGYHDVRAVIGRDHRDNVTGVHGDSWPHADPRWPKACACGFEFGERGEWQFNPDRLFRRSDNGELVTLAAAPVGAMWFAPWYEDHYTGPDGQCLVVRMPGDHDWIVDSRAANCTMPTDTVHRCWIRHGEPPDVTADKNGVTCAAGAGSIATGKWHGFLRAGWLEEC